MASASKSIKHLKHLDFDGDAEIAGILTELITSLYSVANYLIVPVWSSILGQWINRILRTNQQHKFIIYLEAHYI